MIGPGVSRAWSGATHGRRWALDGVESPGDGVKKAPAMGPRVPSAARASRARPRASRPLMRASRRSPAQHIFSAASQLLRAHRIRPRLALFKHPLGKSSAEAGPSPGSVCSSSRVAARPRRPRACARPLLFVAMNIAAQHYLMSQISPQTPI